MSGEVGVDDRGCSSGATANLPSRDELMICSETIEDEFEQETDVSAPALPTGSVSSPSA